MTQAKWTEGPLTFTAGEDLAPFRRVKLENGSTTTPGEVIYADAGEDFIGITADGADDGDLVTVLPVCREGSVLVEAADSFSYEADLYGAADGKISDSSNGTAYFKALEAATAAGDIVEVMVHPGVSTTAATVSISDSGTFTSTATVEAALQEIYQHILTAQGFVPMPLTAWFEGDGTNTVAALGPSTTPTLDLANGDTDSALTISWVATNTDPIIMQIPLPPDIDTGSDLVLHLRAAAGGTDDTITLNADSYFNEGDTKVEDSVDVSGTAYAEKEITIAAADIPSGAQTLTVELTPGSHANDSLDVTATWLEYQKQLLSS